MSRPGSGPMSGARPGGRTPSAAEQRLAASLSGAVDLTGVKKRAEAKKDAEKRGATGSPAVPPGAPVTDFDVDEGSFEQDVLMRSMRVPVIVELTSSRSMTAMSATLSSLAASDGGRWVHARVDVDSAPMVAQAFQVRALPTVVALAGGRPLADFEGEQSADALRAWVDAVLNATEGKLEGPEAGAPTEAPAPGEMADPERDAAENALAEGNLAQAEELFTALVSARPADHSLLEALRYVQAASRVGSAADSTETGGQSASSSGGTAAVAMNTADRQLISGEYPQAFSTIIDAIRVSFGDEKSALRERLVELLDSLPADDERVLTARRNLASALY